MSAFEWVFLVEFVVLMGMRFWYARRMRERRVTARHLDFTERALLVGTLVGMMILPLVNFATDWLAFAHYDPPEWFGWAGVPAAVGAVLLFWRSHADLGTNWSATLEIREQHTVVDTGVYRLIRHPMYAAIWLWVLSQALLVPNWLVGAAGFASFGPMYFLRVPREERMMLSHFGDEYRIYARRTGRVFPRLTRTE
jgi:protein-S-isoprenylcysteine O-methyltransferase Ste14